MILPVSEARIIPRLGRCAHLPETIPRSLFPALLFSGQHLLQQRHHLFQLSAVACTHWRFLWHSIMHGNGKTGPIYHLLLTLCSFDLHILLHILNSIFDAESARDIGGKFKLVSPLFLPIQWLHLVYIPQIGEALPHEKVHW